MTVATIGEWSTDHAAISVCSLPPCGGGLGRAGEGWGGDSVCLVATPLPVPPPQGGRERCGASFHFSSSGRDVGREPLLYQSVNFTVTVGGRAAPGCGSRS